MEKKLLEIIACPSCKQRLIFDEVKKELICRFDKLSFPVRDGVPRLLLDEASKYSEESRA